MIQVVCRCESGSDAIMRVSCQAKSDLRTDAIALSNELKSSCAPGAHFTPSFRCFVSGDRLISTALSFAVINQSSVILCLRREA